MSPKERKGLQEDIEQLQHEAEEAMLDNIRLKNSLLSLEKESCRSRRIGTDKPWTGRTCRGSDKSEVNKRGRPSKWPPECLPSKFADFECAFSL